MNHDTWNTLLIILMVMAVTFGTRAVSFLVFSGKRKTPRIILYLGKVLPFAIMGLLVVYCLKGVSVVSYPYGIPELIAISAVVLLHLWKRNNLISIGGGTVLYMFLVQVVFV